MTLMLVGYGGMLTPRLWVTVPGAIALAVADVSVLGSWFHDAVHQGPKQRSLVSQLVSHVAAAPVGFSQRWWRYKHVRLHHSYPSDPLYDPDIQFGALLRLTEQQKFRPSHRFQIWYVWLLVPFASLATLKPIEMSQARKFRERGITWTAPSAISVFGEKYGSFVLFWSPILYIQSFASALWIWSTFVLSTGVLFTLITQMQHNTELSFSATDELIKFPLSYQFFTASDVDAGRIWTWISGGTTNHVVHHMAPSLSFFELRDATARLKQLVSALGQTYPCHPSLMMAFRSHARLLKCLSKPTATTESYVDKPTSKDQRDDAPALISVQHTV